MGLDEKREFGADPNKDPEDPSNNDMINLLSVILPIIVSTM